MKKELFFAILAGAVFGLIIAFGIWRINSSLSQKEASTNKTEIASSPTPTSQFSIALAKLSDNDVIVQNPVSLSGIAKPDSYLAISSEDKDYLIKTNQVGSFAKDLELSSGINELVFTLFDEENNSIEKRFNLIYSSEFAKFLKEEPTASPTPKEKSASEEAEEIRENVQKKVNEALKHPRAYLGTVTDVSETTLEIKTVNGEIKQVATDKETVFVKITQKDNKETKQEIQFSDVALGDFIVAMGFVNGNSVLNAKRILVTSAPVSLEIKALMGKAAKLGNKEISLIMLPKNEVKKISLSNSTDILLKKDGKFAVIKYSQIEEGETLICFGKENGINFEARTIILIREIASPSPKISPSSSPEE